ncbi:MAG: sigma-70 family RNA polymerase sigma factor [Dehalococcoidia bacterium]
MEPTGSASLQDDAGDEELVLQLAGGGQDALGPLYSRYAKLIYNLAAQTLDRSSAEDIVQDVFLAIWRKADSFDPDRGTFRSWALQIAHYRIANELRRRSRRPQIEPDPEGLRLLSLPDSAPDVEEEIWREYQRSAVRSAVQALPPLQRQALGLAFFEDLTHEQVATVLEVPLGTAKTRIRAGIQKLRRNLAPLGAALVLVVVVSVLGIRYRSEVVMHQREDRAFALVTESHTTAVRLLPASGETEGTHATYRSQPGVSIAVLTLSNFSAAPSGQVYQAWVRHKSVWTSLGVAHPDAIGAARLIAEGPALALPAETIEVTLEPAGGSRTPSGQVIVAWSGATVPAPAYGN